MKIHLSVLFFFLVITGINAQNDPVLITIGGENVTRSEFLAVYHKNNIKEEPATEQNIKEYLELFINYKLKVKEAEALGLDTSTAFKNELAGYRRQLAQPYLSNREVTDYLMQEAWERMQYDLRASHILIRVSPNASPADTLKAYNRIMDIRKKLLAGSPFDEMALKFSEDENAKDKPGKNGGVVKGNRGDLGYFTVLNLYYQFESAAYQLKTGEISMPVRTDLGYHLIKVTDRKPAIGKVQAAHILIKTIPGKEDSALARAREAKNRIAAGESFDAIAKEYSDDKGSAVKGGVLPWFGCFRMSAAFLSPVYQMKPGDVSEPVLTEYGYHIIKVMDKKPIGSYDEVKSNLKIQIGKDRRSFIARDKLVARLKIDYKFSADLKVLKEVLPLITDSIYQASWQVPASPVLEKTVCVIADKSFKLGDFADYLQRKQAQIKKGDDQWTFVQNIFDLYQEDRIIEYENGKLEEKYPEFKALMKEYRDGILLFNLMDKKVWSKAVKDTAGLNAYYETVKNNYLYDQRAEACIYTVGSETDKNTLIKLLKKAPKKGYTPEKIAMMMNKDTIPAVTYQMVLVEKGANALVDKTEWTKGIYTAFDADKNKQIVWMLNIREPEPKPLQEVKGLVTAEYQNYLEQEWVKELRSKYTWKVDESVLKSIYSK